MGTEVDTEAYPPGELIREELEARGWSQQDLADRMGKSHVLVSEVVNAKRSITLDTALALATAFGTSAELWVNLNAQHQLAVAKPKKANASAPLRNRLYSKAPVRDMIKRGWIREDKDLEILKKRVLAFTEQSSLDGEWEFDHAARKSGAYGITTPKQFAWLCRARHLARTVTVARQWRANQLDELVAELQRLILSAPALQQLPRVLSDFGIRFVVVERLPGMKMDGATFWIEDGPVIAVSLTFNRIDNAWHTIMHEVAHVANNDRLAVDVEVLGDDGDKPEAEKRADEFAVNTLVPQDRLNDLCIRVGPLHSQTRVVGFASLIHVHPGIVVGQLHHRGRANRGLEYTHLRRLLIPIRQFITDNALTDGWGKVVPLEIDGE